MKKITICLLFIFLLNVFSSCAGKDEYLVDYPEKYTTSYCSENYIQADPNLVHLRAADNDLGRIEIPGGGARYCKIKDIPLDEYLLLDQYIMFAPLAYKIVKNKNNTDIQVQEILSYKVKSVNIYLEAEKKNMSAEMRKLGLGLVEEYIATVDGADAEAFQSHLIECVEKGNYTKTGPGGYAFIRKDNNIVNLRVSFENYENLVWDSQIKIKDDTYYIVFYTPYTSVGEWSSNYLPINQEMADLIDKLYSEYDLSTSRD